MIERVDRLFIRELTESEYDEKTLNGMRLVLVLDGYKLLEGRVSLDQNLNELSCFLMDDMTGKIYELLLSGFYMILSSCLVGELEPIHEYITIWTNQATNEWNEAIIPTLFEEDKA